MALFSHLKTKLVRHLRAKNLLLIHHILIVQFLPVLSHLLFLLLALVVVLKAPRIDEAASQHAIQSAFRTLWMPLPSRWLMLHLKTSKVTLLLVQGETSHTLVQGERFHRPQISWTTTQTSQS